MTNAITLSISDLTTQNPDEPRILDTQLAKALGMARPTNIRQLVEANREELERYGSLHATNAMIRAGKGAKRETTEYHLNEAQALLLCMLLTSPLPLVLSSPRQSGVRAVMATKGAEIAQGNALRARFHFPLWSSVMGAFWPPFMLLAFRSLIGLSTRHCSTARVRAVGRAFTRKA